MADTDGANGNAALILAAARALFAGHGYSRVTMNDIAGAVSMGKSSLYHYYPGKKELLRAVLEHEADTVRSRIEHALSEATTPADKLRAYAVARMKGLKNLADVFRSFREDYLLNYAFIDTIREDYDRYEVETVAGILREGVDTGDFEIRDIGVTAVAVATALKGLEYDWSVRLSADDIERNLSILTDVLIHGIASRKEDS